VERVFGYASEQHVIQLAQHHINAVPMSQTLAQLLAAVLLFNKLDNNIMKLKLHFYKIMLMTAV